MPHETSPITSSAPKPRAKTSLLRNSDARWGVMAVGLHWSMALGILALFALGLWMTSLGYYDPWYKQGPNLHKSIGVLLLIVLLVRLAWRLFDHTPAPLQSHKAWEQKAAHGAHFILYVTLFTVMFSGYLISTADGRAISVFGMFEIPATITTIEKQEDIAGVVHLWLASILIATALGHALAALKHHFIDKDTTLKRMFMRS